MLQRIPVPNSLVGAFEATQAPSGLRDGLAHRFFDRPFNSDEGLPVGATDGSEGHLWPSRL